jgi:hypothetical protein
MYETGSKKMRATKINISFSIYVPTKLYNISIRLILLYRKLHYGYAFRRIPLTRGKYAIVDPEDYDWLIQYKWHANGRQSGSLYAVNQKKQKMHRLVMLNSNPYFEIRNTKMLVDHINGDSLDNRKANLRLATYAQNSWNSRHGIGLGTSQYKGVIWSRRNRKWEAVIFFDRRRKHLGYFTDERKAAKEYDKAAKKLRGEFAVLNFPKGNLRIKDKGLRIIKIRGSD